MSDGTNIVIGGLMLDIVEKMHRRGHLFTDVLPRAWATRYHASTGFEPEGLKVLLDDLCAEAGVAAVQSIRTVAPAFGLDTDELVSTLRRCGAYLPERTSP